MFGWVVMQSVLTEWCDLPGLIYHDSYLQQICLKLHLIDDAGPCHDATEDFPCLGLGFMGGISQPQKRNPALVV
jgi:hypothetical protein